MHSSSTSSDHCHYRPDDGIPQGNNDQQCKSRGQEIGYRFRNYPPQGLCQRHSRCDNGNHRQEGAGVCIIEGHSQDHQIRTIDGRIAENRANDCSQELIAFQGLGQIHSQENGEEEENCVSRRVNQGLNTTPRLNQTGHLQQCQQALNDTARTDEIQAGADRADYNIQKFHDRIDFFLGFITACRVGHITQLGADLVVNVHHRVSDHHHVLAAAMDHGNNALQVLDDVIIGLGLILQLEPDTGDAVADGVDVILTADAGNDILSPFAFAVSTIE